MIYETPQDREKELEIINEIQPFFLSVDFEQSEKLQEYDFRARINGKIVFLVEVKDRNIKSTDFETVFASKEKSDFAKYIHKFLPVYFIVRFIDCIKLFNLWDADIEGKTIQATGRPARPVVEFIIAKGKTLKKY